MEKETLSISGDKIKGFDTKPIEISFDIAKIIEQEILSNLRLDIIQHRCCDDVILKYKNKEISKIRIETDY